MGAWEPVALIDGLVDSDAETLRLWLAVMDCEGDVLWLAETLGVCVSLADPLLLCDPVPDADALLLALGLPDEVGVGPQPSLRAAMSVPGYDESSSHVTPPSAEMSGASGSA